MDLKTEIIEDIINNNLLFVSKKEDQSDWITVKYGEKTPIFFEFHKLLSHPKIMKKIIKLTTNLISEEKMHFDQIVGITYGGLNFAMCLSYDLDKPSLCIRHKQKKLWRYGANNGNY